MISVFSRRPGPAAIAGTLLLLSGLVLNRVTLERAFAPDGAIENGFTRTAILVLQAVLVLAGTTLLVARARLAGRVARAALIVATPLAALAAYSAARALTPLAVGQNQMARMERSERLYIAIVPRMQALNAAAMNLELPGSAEDALFAPGLVVDTDLRRASVDIMPRLSDVRRVEWPVAEAAVQVVAVSAPGSGLGGRRIWAPFFASARFLYRANFAIVHARFGDAEERHWETEIHFTALARTAAGAVAQADGEIEASWVRDASTSPDPLAPEGWRIARWRTLSFTVGEAPRSMFEDVLAAALPRESDREQATVSLHDRYVVEHFRTKKSPHEFFTYQDFDRHPGLAVVDVDGDGLDDLYVMSEFGRNMLLHNQGDGTFRDIAPEVGLDVDGFSTSAVFADFDNDGDLDLVLGRSLRPSMYFENVGGHFVDHSERLGPAPPSLVSSVAAADYDGDGLLDVYFATYAAEMFFSHPESPELFLSPSDAAEFRRRVAGGSHWLQARVGPPNVLLKNAGQGRFVTAPASREVQVWRNSYEGTFADYDHDGHPDLYVVNDFGENNLFHNDGRGHFEDVTSSMGAGGLGFGMGASFGDYDNDGKTDLYVSNMYSKAGQRVIENLGEDASEFAPLARGNTLLRRVDSHFQRVSGTKPPAMLVERAGWSWGSQFVDLNNDGYLDIYALAGYYTAPPEIAIPVDT